MSCRTQPWGRGSPWYVSKQGLPTGLDPIYSVHVPYSGLCLLVCGASVPAAYWEGSGSGSGNTSSSIRHAWPARHARVACYPATRGPGGFHASRGKPSAERYRRRRWHRRRNRTTDVPGLPPGRHFPGNMCHVHGLHAMWCTLRPSIARVRCALVGNAVGWSNN